jgi:3-oxoacyl-[acyl-carrier-protein] synthase-3
MKLSMAAVSIRQIEYYLPENRVTNDDLARKNPDWNMGKVVPKTGVLSRAFAGPDEFASDLAYQAVLKIFQSEEIARQEIDAIVYCTQSPDYIMPPNSTLLQARLDLPKSVAAFDFTLACSGFIYGLAISGSLMTTLPYDKVLLITADTYSKYIHPRDRSALTLFGDGAAATLLERSTGASRLIDFELATDGHGGEHFMIRAGGSKVARSATTCIPKRDLTGNERSDENLQMNGPAVLEFAKREIPACILKILDRNGLTIDQIDLILFHQASAYAIAELTKHLRIPPDKTFSNIAHVGNTVSSSIPILLKDAERAGILKRDQWVVLVGFGVGFSWGCCLLRW